MPIPPKALWRFYACLPSALPSFACLSAIQNLPGAHSTTECVGPLAPPSHSHCRPDDPSSCCTAVCGTRHTCSCGAQRCCGRPAGHEQRQQRGAHCMWRCSGRGCAAAGRWGRAGEPGPTTAAAAEWSAIGGVQSRIGCSLAGSLSLPCSPACFSPYCSAAALMPRSWRALGLVGSARI